MILTKEELLKMEVHEVGNVPCESHDMSVRRVFGGWIYTSMAWNPDRDIMTSSCMCFVPEVVNVEAHMTDITDRTHQY